MWLQSMKPASYGTDVAVFLYRDLAGDKGIMSVTLMPSDPRIEDIMVEHSWTGKAL